MVWATMDGLTQLLTVSDVARQRGADPAEIDYRPRQEVVDG
jgi:hypothetical protein